MQSFIIEIFFRWWVIMIWSLDECVPCSLGGAFTEGFDENTIDYGGKEFLKNKHDLFGSNEK